MHWTYPHGTSSNRRRTLSIVLQVYIRRLDRETIFRRDASNTNRRQHSQRRNRAIPALLFEGQRNINGRSFTNSTILRAFSNKAERRTVYNSSDRQLNANVLGRTTYANGNSNNVSRVISRRTILAFSVTRSSINSHLIQANSIAHLISRYRQAATGALHPLLHGAGTTHVQESSNGVIGLIKRAITGMISRRQRDSGIISEAIRRTLKLHHVRISARSTINAYNLRRIRRRATKGKLTTTVLLILTQMTGR